MTRTLEESLARAQNLRDFRFTSPKAFERNDDFEDIVNLADLDEQEEDNYEAFLDDVFYCPHQEVSMMNH